MEARKSKWITIGDVCEFNGKRSLNLNIRELRTLAGMIKAYGEKYLAGLSDAEVVAALKAKAIPRLSFGMGEPKEGSPEFIKASVFTAAQE